MIAYKIRDFRDFTEIMLVMEIMSIVISKNTAIVAGKQLKPPKNLPMNKLMRLNCFFFNRFFDFMGAFQK